MLLQLLAVAVGGACGSSLRFAVARILPTVSTGFPWATVAVNLAGCLLIGLIVSWSEERGGLSENVNALAVTGFLGGFTTFSAFGLDAVLLARETGPVLSAGYLAVQVVGGMAAVFLGFWLGRFGW